MGRGIAHAAASTSGHRSVHLRVNSPAGVRASPRHTPCTELGTHRWSVRVPAQSSTAPAASGSKLPWIIVVVLLLAIAGGGVWWFMQSRAAPAAAGTTTTPAKPARPPASYYALEPAFVVNLADTDAVRYLQADVQIMTREDRKSTRLNSSHVKISYAVFCLKKKKR